MSSTESAQRGLKVKRFQLLKFKLDRKALETIYLTFIRSILEYGDVLWDNCSQYEKNELEKIQNEAVRIATGATKLVSLNALYNEIQWENLEERRKKYKLNLISVLTISLPLFHKLSNTDHATILETQTILIQLMPEQPFITILF